METSTIVIICLLPRETGRAGRTVEVTRPTMVEEAADGDEELDWDPGQVQEEGREEREEGLRDRRGRADEEDRWCAPASASTENPAPSSASAEKPPHPISPSTELLIQSVRRQRERADASFLSSPGDRALI